MKKFLLTLDDKLHKEIKLKAIEAEKSMHQYILDCITYTWADRKRLKDSAEALAKPPMFKDVVEQSEETPYWKGDIKTGQMTEYKETTTEPKKFKGGYTKEQSVGKKPKRK